jgi:hypothetical protein
MREDAVIYSTYLTGEEPVRSSQYLVAGQECTTEFSYCDGLSELWYSDKTIINHEHDMEFSDELVAGLVDCPNPLCAYAYQVFPTKLQRYIYCATRGLTLEEELEPLRQEIEFRLDDQFPNQDHQALSLDLAKLAQKQNHPETPEDWKGVRNCKWIEQGDEWANWSSIGFCKIGKEARIKPLDRMFWQYLEHAINRVVAQGPYGYGAGLVWHIHWPEVVHFHDYNTTPDHLW